MLHIGGCALGRLFGVVFLHLKSALEGKREELPDPTMSLPQMAWELLDFGKMFQKRRVSSPAPVTIEDPSGLIARYSTRYVWPVSVAIFSIVGYFHTMTWLSE